MNIGRHVLGLPGDVHHAGAVVEHGLHRLARVGGGVVFPMVQRGFEMLDGRGLLLDVGTLVKEREVAGAADFGGVVKLIGICILTLRE